MNSETNPEEAKTRTDDQRSYGKRPFISQRPEELNTSNFLTIPLGDNRYVNETDFQVNALR